ncbi:HD domain-containing protein, partial [Candidatus Saccharibacteria bacterium]|nr:HD domain-containing protein [Candidatus Saccharibacteria bacterium]
MSIDLDKLLDFARFTHEIRKVERMILLEGEDHYENDAEHSYQMAIIALFIIDSNGLKLDRYKCMAMAIAHDVIEVYAGDTLVFAPQKDLDAKTLREKKAIEKLKTNWPNIPSLHSLIKEYETRQSPEAKFVYALDKLMPEINNYLYEGRIWRQLGVNLGQVKKIKQGKIDIDTTIKDYHQQLLRIIEQKPELFGEPDESRGE